MINSLLPIEVKRVLARESSVLRVEVVQPCVSRPHVRHATALGIKVSRDRGVEDGDQEPDAENGRDKGRKRDSPWASQSWASPCESGLLCFLHLPDLAPIRG
jgi:hypothetical protein